jgi:ADP-ribose pyrophosphatase YjhB (NUDIX family)
MKKFQRYAGVILKKDNKVLLCKRSPEKSLPNTWSIPSGHLEDGESPGQGAIREFHEETNIELDTDISLVGFLDKMRKDGITKKGMVYVFLKETDEDLKPDLEKASDGFEHTECGFFSQDNLPEQEGNEDLMKIIKKILK